ncbi:MAG TPA: HesA/MoeB/ThiF family protein [Candidatus Margulisiibacteriota bacterium]|nr:HesA/MoeB/ThiF family protein [Candidatus Margulisiibacteriota bacterium]
MLREANEAAAPLRRLAQRRVLIVGVGGLGAPAALRLAVAGVGTLGLIDGDAVELSNLHRQIIYRTTDIGRSKVAAAATRLQTLCPSVKIEPLAQRLTPDNVATIFAGFDFVIDATDGSDSKYLVNDAAVLCGVPFSHAGVLGFQGQLMTVVPHHSACLRCVFPFPPEPDELPTCQEAGILGSVAGTVGTLQATEALKFLLGEGRHLGNRLLTYDALAVRWRTIVLARHADCPLCGAHPTIRAPLAAERRACE